MSVYDTLRSVDDVHRLQGCVVRFSSGKALKIGPCLTDPFLFRKCSGLPGDKMIEWLTQSLDGKAKGTITAETMRKHCMTFYSARSPPPTRRRSTRLATEPNTDVQTRTTRSSPPSPRR